MAPWLLALLLLLPLPCRAAAPAALPARDHTELRVKLDPAAQTLDVNGTLTVRVTQPGTVDLTWQLNRQLEIRELMGPLVSDWAFNRDPAGAGPGLLKVRFRRPLGPADRVQFRLHYRGTLSRWPERSPNLVTAAWTELGRALAWYPLRPEGGPFTFSLQVTCPKDYALASYGPFLGGRTLAWPHPVTDLVLVAAPRERLHTWTPAPRVRLVTTDLGALPAQRLAGAMAQVLAALQKRLGSREAASMTLIQGSRASGGPYARSGLLVLEGLSEAQVTEGSEDILHLLALETARAWWHAAPTATWENWLNEGFAEFSALVALRDALGEAVFQRRIEHKRRICVGLPPLWQFDPAAREAEAVMESKSVVLLAELEGFVGRERFGALVRACADRQVAGTLAFLDLLEAREGKAVRESFQRRIMSF
jgi:hypothetical protein